MYGFCFHAHSHTHVTQTKITTGWLFGIYFSMRVTDDRSTRAATETSCRFVDSRSNRQRCHANLFLLAFFFRQRICTIDCNDCHEAKFRCSWPHEWPPALDVFGDIQKCISKSVQWHSCNPDNCGSIVIETIFMKCVELRTLASGTRNFLKLKSKTSTCGVIIAQPICRFGGFG